MAGNLEAALAEALACAESCRTIRHEITQSLSAAGLETGAAIHATGNPHIVDRGPPVAPEPELEPEAARCVDAGSAAARLEQQLASRERVCDSLKVQELQTLIEGRGARPVTAASGPLRVALIRQAKLLPPAAVAGAPRAGAAPAWLQRTSLLLGDTALADLAAARVLVVGMGGVGSWCAEFLVRAGIGHLTIIDDDVVDPTNRNRQLPALVSTEGCAKVHVMADRLRDINPDVEIVARQTFLPPNAEEVDAVVKAGMSGLPFHYVVDAIDTITPKVELIRAALKHRVRVVSSMGAGGRLDPSKVVVVDLSQLHCDRRSLTKAVHNAKAAAKHSRRSAHGTWEPQQHEQLCAHDKLGSVVRKKLAKDYGIEGGVTVVTSTESPRKAFDINPGKAKNKASFYGTLSVCPAQFGLHAASAVLNGLLAGQDECKEARELRAAAEVAAACH